MDNFITTTFPTNEALLHGLQEYRLFNPSSTKTYEHLTKMNSWSLTRKQLQSCMNEHNLNPKEDRRPKDAELQRKRLFDTPSPNIPNDPLQTQLNYRKRSGRAFMLYGSGEFDYGVKLAFDMQEEYLAKCQNDLADWVFNYHLKGQNLPARRQEELTGPAFDLWAFYRAAAAQAGLSEKNALHQFKYEYLWDPISGSEEELAERAADKMEKDVRHQEDVMAHLRKVARRNPGLVNFDVKGRPVWNEKLHGRFAMTIFWVDRDGGDIGGV